MKRPISNLPPALQSVVQALSKSDNEPLKQRRSMGSMVEFVDVEDDVDTDSAEFKNADGTFDLSKAIRSTLYGKKSVERLSFEFDPKFRTDMFGLYRGKRRLLPDDVLKTVAIRDPLVAAIIQARQNHISSFGRRRRGRFEKGLVIEIDQKRWQKMGAEEQEKWNERIDEATALLESCGKASDQPEDRQHTLFEWLSVSARSAVTVGRIATEMVYTEEADPEARKFHHFVAVDAGSVYPAARGDHQKEAEAIRRQAAVEIMNVLGEKVSWEQFQENAQYVWVQVIASQRHQVFTNKEMRCRNFYPAADIELDGFPVTPIDTVIGEITTHIHIGTHNRVYFQNGRAARGMLVIKAEGITPSMVKEVKSKFKASIDNVNNSFRVPVFGIEPDEEISWEPLDTAQRDMEFQYLSDQNCRAILTAFMMSPDELPGWGYLSKGTNSQSLSEANNEYKLTAARDVGIRPLLTQFEDFINAEIFPEIDRELSQIARVYLRGLDADTPEKEATRTAQDSQLWMTMDQILERVEIKPIGAEWGGTIPLNQAYQTSILFALFTVGEILEKFCNKPGYGDPKLHPELAYRRDQFWFSQVEVMQAQQQAQQQAQMAAQGGPPGGGSGGGGGGDGGGGSGGGSGGGQVAQDPNQPGADPAKGGSAYDQKTGSAQSAAAQPGKADDLTRAISQGLDLMSKSEASLPPAMRQLLEHANRVSDDATEALDRELAPLTAELQKIAGHFAPAQPEVAMGPGI